MTLAMKLDEEREIGREIGIFEGKVSAVREGRNKGNDAFLIKILSLSEEQFSSICDLLDTYPEKSDLEIAKEILLG